MESGVFYFSREGFNKSTYCASQILGFSDLKGDVSEVRIEETECGWLNIKHFMILLQYVFIVQNQNKKKTLPHYPGEFYGLDPHAHSRRGCQV